MIEQQKTLSQINYEAIRSLCNNIGIANTLRFLNQFTVGYGDYTKERQTIFKDKPLNEIISYIKAARKQSN